MDGARYLKIKKPNVEMYSNHLNTRQVWFLNGPNISSCRMVRILNGKVSVLWSKCGVVFFCKLNFLLPYLLCLRGIILKNILNWDFKYETKMLYYLYVTAGIPSSKSFSVFWSKAGDEVAVRSSILIICKVRAEF